MCALQALSRERAGQSSMHQDIQGEKLQVHVQWEQAVRR